MTLKKLHPHLEEPDFIFSLGTGEPTRTEDATSWKHLWRNGALRTCLMAWEKMRDTSVRQAFHGRPQYLRFNVKMDGAEPRLDQVDSMALWES